MVRATKLAMAPSVIRAPDVFLLLAAAHAAHAVVTALGPRVVGAPRVGAPLAPTDVGTWRRPP